MDEIDGMDEIGTPLAGGNSNVVVRIGTTVRRRMPPHGDAVHALLAHLETAGFRESPRYLGTDSRGREVLGFIDGEAGTHPHSAAVRSDEALAGIVRLARRYHDATQAFVADATAMTWPGQRVAGLGLPAEVVCHGDLAPYNMIFDGPTAVGIVDFDNATPGARVEDLAYLAYRLAPLCAERNYPDAGWSDDVDRFGRLRRVVELYGELDRTPLLDIVLARLTGFCDWIRQRAAAGDPAVDVHVRDDHVGIYETDMAWIAANRRQLETALGL